MASCAEDLESLLTSTTARNASALSPKTKPGLNDFALFMPKGDFSSKVGACKSFKGRVPGRKLLKNLWTFHEQPGYETGVKVWG